MACGVALKRSLDFDPLHSPNPSVSCDDNISTPSAKRRKYSIAQRCGSVTPVTSTPPSVSPSVWRRYASSTNAPSTSGMEEQSPFAAITKKNSFSSDEIVKHIYQEYKRMKKRKQLCHPALSASPSNSQEMFTDPSSSRAPLGNAVSFATPLPSISLDPKNNCSVILSGKQNSDTPLLSMKQVGLICERLLKEQEEKLCSEYEKALVSKLSEQYDAFVKFSHDQLRQQMQGRPASSSIGQHFYVASTSNDAEAM